MAETKKEVLSDAEKFAELTRPRFVCKELIEQKGHSVGVVVSFDGFREQKFKDKNTGEEKIVEKPDYTIQIKGHNYGYSLTAGLAKKFKAELEMKEPKDLIGQKLKFEMKNAGGKDYVDASVIPKEE